ncbi:hypothetical protein, variant 2 [Aphanomyces astaci]|uniref:UBX domain-containing protein n=1 Tax=Aphanomyces astaci TaxID=112090 RepID=W4GYC0_APHAT|nr:hypothetical protein, variant 2 [Aphanomyces astaci]ETV84014.1 hypothetical protein, variant 2 [Aphanomyces astaci]|eukprot:XP_009825706.1 hypothetical protein, variant 2 [Aphanomyces astaci]
MDFDLGSRGKKLQKEQAARREAARLKMEREKALVEKTNQLRVEMEVEAQRRRDELAQQAAADEERRVEEQRITGGIVYKKSLRAVPIANDGDKVTLPVSALEELNPQNALDLGVFTFELVAGGHTTHASVLEFVADEHTIGIPPKVARSLHLMDEAVDIAVRFVRLEKGRAVKLQPRGDGFGDRQIDIKHLLERTLHTHTTLTEGDILLVRHGKVTFEVAVKEIVPEPQVTILNVDLEVDLLPSEAIDRQITAKQVAAQQLVAAEQAQQRLHEQSLQRQADALARLPPEPPLDDDAGVIKLMVRTPDGSQHARRFAASDSVATLYDFVTSITGLASFLMATNYPRRVIPLSTLPLQDAGFRGRQEAVFVEPCKAPTAVPDQAVNDVDMQVDDAARVPADAWGHARARWETIQDEVLCISPIFESIFAK